MKKILVALDGSQGSSRVVDYIGRQFSGMGDLSVTLFHVMPGIIPELWDDGHILTEEEKAERKTVLEKWLSNQKLKLAPFFRTAVEALTHQGIRPEQIETKSVAESISNIPECILAEARTGGYTTLVMGRCGHSSTAHFLMGSTSNKIINTGAGIPVCLVE
jgi:nucleotide-binding universal stress UspA family protein